MADNENPEPNETVDNQPDVDENHAAAADADAGEAEREEEVVEAQAESLIEEAPSNARPEAPPVRQSQPSISTSGTVQNVAPPTSEKKWYIVHTYSGHENKAKLTLLERVRNANLNEWFGDVLVPTESVIENVKGQRRTTTRKFFPGYMFVQMILDDRTFHLVKNTPKITGFLGGTKPTPVPEREITGVQTNMNEGKAKPKARVVFEVGDAVRVTDGPFANFSAKIIEVRADKQKVKVSLSMLGRATSVELDFTQVEKA